MKRMIISLMIVMVAMPLFSITSDDFIKEISNKNYENAIKIGSELAEKKPFYNYLVAVCYHNLFDYDNYHLYKTYIVDEDIKKMDDFLIKIENEYIDDSNVLTYLGIIKTFLPELSLIDPEKLFLKSLELDEENEYAANYLSFFYSRNGNLDKTIDYAKLAIEINPEFPEPYMNLSYAYGLKREYEKSRITLLNCIENCPIAPINLYQSIINLFCDEVSETVNINGEYLILFGPGITNEEYLIGLYESLHENDSHVLGIMNEFADRGMSVMVRSFLNEFEYLEGKYPNDINYYRCIMAKLHNDNQLLTKYTNLILENANYEKDYHLIELAGMNIEYGNIEIARKIYQYALKVVIDKEKWKTEWINERLEEL